MLQTRWYRQSNRVKLRSDPDAIAPSQRIEVAEAVEMPAHGADDQYTEALYWFDRSQIVKWGMPDCL